MQWTIRGKVDGVPDQVVNYGRWKVVGDHEVRWFANSESVGATSHLVEVFQGGRVIRSAVIPAGEHLFTTRNVCSAYVWWRPFVCMNPVIDELDLVFEGEDIAGDSVVRVSPVNASSSVEFVSMLELTAANMPEFDGDGNPAVALHDEALDLQSNLVDLMVVRLIENGRKIHHVSDIAHMIQLANDHAQ